MKKRKNGIGGGYSTFMSLLRDRGAGGLVVQLHTCVRGLVAGSTMRGIVRAKERSPSKVKPSHQYLIKFCSHKDPWRRRKVEYQVLKSPDRVGSVDRIADIILRGVVGGTAGYSI